MLAHWAIAPFGDAFMYVTSAVQRRDGGTAVSEEELRRVETLFKAYLQDYQAEVSSLRARVPEMERIYGRLPRSKFPYELIWARVVARDALPYGSTGLLSFAGGRRVNEGARVTTPHLLTPELSKALQKDLPALAPPPDRPAVADCVLVGRLKEAWAFGGALQLVTDPAFSTPARVQRVIADKDNPRTIRVILPNRARSEPLTASNNNPIPVVVEGRGDYLIARDVSENENVLPGDIVSTVEDPLLPTPVLIGEVARVDKDVENPGRVTLRIKSAADLDNLRFVYIVATTAAGPKN